MDYAIDSKAVLMLEPVAKKLREARKKKGSIRKDEVVQLVKETLHLIPSEKARHLVGLVLIAGPNSKERRELSREKEEHIRRTIRAAVNRCEPLAFCKVCGVFFGFKKSFSSYAHWGKGWCSGKCALSDPEVKAARAATNIPRYGKPNPNQNKRIRNKAKRTMLARYGVDNASKSEDVKARKAQTLLNNYGVTNPSKSAEIQGKKVATSQERYGVNYPNQSSEVRAKTVATCMKRYGMPSTGGYLPRIEKARVKHLATLADPKKRSDIRKATRLTCMERYGETSPSKVPELAEKGMKARFARKSVTIQGKRFENLQGYEPYALEFLASRGINIKSVKTGPKAVGGFYYRFLGKDRTYYPDIRVNGSLVEVKSTFTAGLEGVRNSESTGMLRAKMRAVEQAGERIYCLIRVCKHKWVVIQSSYFTKPDVVKAVSFLKKGAELYRVVGDPSPVHKPA